jgi:hypothetical protein
MYHVEMPLNLPNVGEKARIVPPELPCLPRHSSGILNLVHSNRSGNKAIEYLQYCETYLGEPQRNLSV